MMRANKRERKIEKFYSTTTVWTRIMSESIDE